MKNWHKDTANAPVMPYNTLISNQPMTRKEFYEKYGDVKVKFSSYYKYTFTYTGNLPDGGKISVDCGANADDIYRFEVGADCEEIINSLEPYAGTAYDKDGKKVDEFYDY